MVSMPKILVLDEATSSIDTKTEILVQRGIENLLKGRTSFVIAHRLSTIQHADRIFVVDDGHIVAFRPDLNGERMEDSARRLEMPAFPKERFVDAVTKGVYYQLYMAQFSA
jgi:ATP-binding cassette subfamily B protein